MNIEYDMFSEQQTVKEEVVELFERYVKDRSEANATDIYCYIRKNYNTLFNRNIESEDVFQEIMLRLFSGGIEEYLELAKKSVEFRAYWFMSNKKVVTQYTNPNANVTSIYNILKKVSEKYNIKLCKENAYLFERLTQDRSDLTITRIIRVIEEQAIICHILYKDSLEEKEYKEREVIRRKGE